jgi:aldose 1-epimerase
MFSVHHIVKSESHQEYLELYSPNKDSYAKIHLSQGGSLQVLTLNGHEVIKDLSPMTMKRPMLQPYSFHLPIG